MRELFSENRVLVAGSTGYIGRAVVRELVSRGYGVVSLLRQTPNDPQLQDVLAGSDIRVCDVCDPGSLARHGFRGESFDAVISCIASRSGAPVDAWRVDHDANRHLLAEARKAGAHFVLLSAICVQYPRLAFQRAKLAFERALMDSGLNYSIVRPTAYFKSLGGQIQRVKCGKAFLHFGNGERTACKPISEHDLARFIADCITDPDKRNQVLPVGGPGPALTPRQQGEMLFELTGQSPRYRRVPLWFLDGIITFLDMLGRYLPKLRDRAEFARIGRYYATESMLVRNPSSGRYEADATPEFGEDSLKDFYRRALDEGMAGQELGEHALFGRSRMRKARNLRGDPVP